MRGNIAMTRRNRQELRGPVNRKSTLPRTLPLESNAHAAYGRRDTGIHVGHTVSDQPNKPPKSAKDARAERLAAELRENLKKRKAQARARKSAAPQKPEGD